MKEFLIENYSWLISVIFTLLSVFVFLLKKVKIINKDTAFEKVLDNLPILINNAENTFKSGAEKKDYVIKMALILLSQLIGHEMDVSEVRLYSSRIDEAVEAILSTPRKKGLIDEIKK